MDFQDKSKEPEPKEKEKDKTRSKSKERDSKSKTKEANIKPDKERSKSKEKSSTKDKEKKSSKSDKEKKEKSAKKPKMEEQVPASRRGSVVRVPEPGPAFDHVEQETHLDSHDEEQSATAKTEDSGFGTEMDRTISPRPPPPELREQTSCKPSGRGLFWWKKKKQDRKWQKRSLTLTLNMEAL
ncbi:unnamed protein product, partial [Mesorhabditis spiculigera]